MPDSLKNGSDFEEALQLNTVQTYFKLAGVVFVLWLVGYFQYSVSWPLLFLVVYVWKERHAKIKHHKLAIRRELARDEKTVILARVEDLPSWVNFPDVERAEWLNKMLDQMWPYIGEFVKKTLRESVEPVIRDSMPSAFKSFKFSKIDMGDVPPRIGGIKVYTQLKRQEIYMDMEINYYSDAVFTVTIKGVSAGIKDFWLHGTMRMVLRPLINRPPLVGGIQVFFLNNPELGFDLTNVANVFDMPGLSDMLHNIIQEQIANLMVLPNRYPIELAEGLDLSKFRYPLPEGVVRVTVQEAKDLKRADVSLTGKGRSDPYVVVRVGDQTMTTKIIQNSSRPVWDETFEFILDTADGQLLYLDVFDQDKGSKDDDIGRTSMDLSKLREDGKEDEWLQLEDVEKGLLHVNLTWLWLANDPLELDRVLADTSERESIHSAMLMVYLDSAFNLPRGTKYVKEPSPQMTLSVGQSVQQSSLKVDTSEPRWEESFRFMVRNPNYQNLDLELTDTKAKKTIGGSAIKLKELLMAEDMVMDQKFHVKTSDPDSYVNMRLCLRILTPKANPKWTENDEELFEDAVEQTAEEKNGPLLDDERGNTKDGGRPQTKDTKDVEKSISSESLPKEKNDVRKQSSAKTEKKKQSKPSIKDESANLQARNSIPPKNGAKKDSIVRQVRQPTSPRIDKTKRGK